MKADEAMLLPTLHKELVNEAFAFMFPWLGDLSEQDVLTLCVRTRSSGSSPTEAVVRTWLQAIHGYL